MNRHDENKLIVALLSGRDARLVRDESLKVGLAAVRGKGRRRRMARSISLVCVPAVAGLLLVLISTHRPEPVAPAASAPAPAAQTAPQAPPVIERINDQQLLALFPDRTVALIGPPGHEQFLVFDAPAHVD